MPATQLKAVTTTGLISKEALTPLLIGYMREQYRLSFKVDEAIKALEEFDKYDKTLESLMDSLYTREEQDRIHEQVYQGKGE